MLIVAPILIHCDLEKLFILDIGWLRKNSGAILSQKPSHMKKHMVDFASKGLSKSLRDYHPIKGECYV
jgi:hypothetical protein